jgi:aminoglycoside phosphotransferase (APT) family kinase protein
LTDLAAWVEGRTEDAALLAALTPKERNAWLEAAPTMVQACQRLEDLGPEPSLVHGDFHPWNVALRDEEALVFDWSDTSVAHPALDVVTYVMRSRDPANRESLLQRYVDGWADYLSDAARQELGDLALVVGGLHQAHTYARLIPTVMPEDLCQLRGGDVQWIQRTLRFRDEGVRAKY